MHKWVLVTGGAKGLGAEISRSLAKEGYNVVIHYRFSKQQAEETATSCRKFGVLAETIAGDYAKLDSFLAGYLERFPDTWAVINNVGNFEVGPLSTASTDQVKELFESNVYAPLAIIQHLLPSLKKNRGAVVNLGLAGIERFYADTYCAAYSMAKAALWQATRSLARELAEDGVRINMVSPAYMESSVVMPQTMKLPMDRPAYLSEVAQAVTYLISDKAAYITGQNLEVAGGVRL
jgi:NAD(P)-dependent dehydrogenase (short-subunit alcohol dehydrogenase family)